MELYATVVGGGSKAIVSLGQNQKTTIFANGQFSGHLIFYKKTFFIFLKKSIFLFFWKKMFFFGNIFSKLFF